ncbi:hypothetical protein BU25DRAFT_123436 [Macroventuria anomochaeta]|uniref:Uncharacterized protein n=1 Tax=Macroventuria anomochaeta TaxID=301207 RepID=A0ACB6RT34_9PLEO|nr:uncharacterized protein BU25DRAFT_123436 [Macroventuria anomochaeta]KAF2625145.1 hypothetical protein BU25DRAFT_123436 [Macroventuria anomochaeta]
MATPIHRSAVPGCCCVTCHLVSEAAPHTCTSSPLHRSTLRKYARNCSKTLHGEVQVATCGISASPSLLQRRLQPHLHLASYGSDRANVDDPRAHEICNIALLRTTGITTSNR